jgi:hypothetical protein
MLGEIVVTPKPEFGEPSSYDDIDLFIDAVSKEKIHPFDAKMAIAEGLSEILSPINEHFNGESEILSAMNAITG